MRIGIDIRTLMDTRYSGVSEYTKNLLAELLKLNQEKKQHEMVLFYNSGKDIDDKMKKFATNNCRIVRTSYPNKIFNYFLNGLGYWPKLDRLTGAGIFFMPHVNFASFTSQAKLIITIHDLSFMRYREFYSWRKTIWHTLVGVKKLARRADIVIAVSENTKRDLIELLDVPAEKIRVIYSGIDSMFFNEISREALVKVKENYNLPAKYIFYLGTIEPRKNIIGLIEAFSDYVSENQDRDLSLVLAGGWGWRTQKIKQAVENCRYRDRIRILEYVKAEDKPALFHLASVFVYPSFYEGYGFPPLEALACGTKVVMGNNSSLPEVAGPMAIMIDPYNTGQITRALTIALKNDLLIEDKAKIASKIRRDHNWRLTAEKYYDLLK